MNARLDARCSLRAEAAGEAELTHSWPHATSKMRGRRIGRVVHRTQVGPAVGLEIDVNIHHWLGAFPYRCDVRSCTRSGCRETAEVSLEFQYSSSTIWIDDLADEREPNVYELCAKHWSRFAPPSGWSLDDRRRAEVLPFVHRLAG
ncbi:MAG: hypothetical protein RLZ37_1289 [Actinomycetota bacterium]